VIESDESPFNWEQTIETGSCGSMAMIRKKKEGPWVAAATICEKLLQERDNVLSIIRMVDVFNVPKPPTPDAILHLPLTGIVAFRSGGVKGTRAVRVYGVSPIRKRKKILDVKVEFLGGNSGSNIRLDIIFAVKSEGQHWLDVYVDKLLVTRVPVMIVFQEPQLAEPAKEIDLKQ